MHPLVAQLLGALVRWALAFLAGYLVKAGIWTQPDAEQWAAAAAVALVALGWSLWQKYRHHLKFGIALDLPAGSSHADVDAALAEERAFQRAASLAADQEVLEAAARREAARAAVREELEERRRRARLDL